MAKAGPRQAHKGSEDVKARLVDATVRVLAREGFAHTSARAIASEAGGVNGLIFYHFGSMDELLTATVRTLADRGIERIHQGLGGTDAPSEWPGRLADVLRTEVAMDDSRAVMELLAGARTSPVLAAEVRAAIDRALLFITDQLESILGDSPVAHVLPVSLLAELAGSAFLGMGVLAQTGHGVDVDRLASTVALAITAITPPAH